MNKGIDRFENGYPYSKNRKLVCPRCSKVFRTPDPWNIIGSDKLKIIEPVYLVVKENTKNNQKFLGCPNFPKCKHSDDILSVRLDKIRNKVSNIDYDDELRPY